MNKTEVINQLSRTIEERILIIEAILQTVKNDMKLSASPPPKPEHNPLRGKVIRYDDPYEPVAAEDWEVLA